MLHNLIERILNGMSVGGRMLRELFIRFFTRIRVTIRSLFSAVNIAGKTIPKLFKKIIGSFKKPTSRDDYIETNGMFIAKNLVLLIIVGVIALFVVGFTVVRPYWISKYGVAHLWEEHKKVESYDGRVVLYYDKEKTKPKFEGRLAEGVKTGEAKEYDETGELTFTGNYAEGVRSGKAVLYQNGHVLYDGGLEGENYTGKGKLYGDSGELLFEGGFAESLYDGEGILYYPDGKIRYEGGFKAGLYDGQGTLREDTENNDITYKGAFQAGTYEGQGTLTELWKGGEKTYRGGFSGGIYDGEGELSLDGVPMYKGGFSEGLYSGTGRLFDEDGKEQYRGDFAEGLFSGDGVYTAPNGITIAGTFEKGVVTGDAECSYGGDVFYKGNMNRLIPQGTGTFYSKTGSELYTGEILAWNVNGSSLLGLSASDARAVFPQGVTEDLGYDGFSLTQEKLGLSLYAGYATEEEEAAVKRAYLMPKAGDSTMDMIRWKTPEDYEAALREVGRDTSCRRGTGMCILPDVYHSLEYIARKPKVSFRAYEQEDGSVLILWCKSTGTTDDSILLCEWRTAADAAEFTGKEADPSGGVPLSEAFAEGQDGTGEPEKPGKDLESLSDFLMEDMTLARTADSNVREVLLTFEEEEEKRDLLDNLAAFTGHSAGKEAADANTEIYTGLAEAQRQQIAIGKAEKDSDQELEEKKKAAEAVSVEKDLLLIELEKSILSETGKEAAELDNQTVLLVVNPEELTAEELEPVILAKKEEAAQKEIEEHTVMVGPGSTALEEGFEPAAVDPEAVKQDLSFEMRALSALYKGIGLAREDLAKAKEQVQKAEKAMSTGAGTQEALELSKAQCKEKQAALISYCADFTREMVLLDRMTGGYISAKYRWFKDADEVPEIPVGVEGNG